MKRFVLLLVCFCLLLCSCSSVSDNDDDVATSSDAADALNVSSAQDDSAAEAILSDDSEFPIYDQLREYFQSYSTYGASAVALTSVCDLLEVYRYMFSEDARAWISMREEIVEGSAYNDYLINTYTDKFFGYKGKNYDNYLIAVMVISNNASDRYSVTAVADDDVINVNVKLTDSYYIPRDDGGLFIYLVPMAGVYKGQELVVTRQPRDNS